MPSLDEGVIPLLITSCLDQHIKRLNKQKDPVIKYSLFLEVIRTVTDIILKEAELSFEEEISKISETEIPLEEESSRSKKKVDPKEQFIKAKTLERLQRTYRSISDLKKELNTYFDDFASWIIQPNYSPDHPFGNQMKEVEKDAKTMMSS